MSNYKDKFIKQSNKIHNNKYDYSLVEYINIRTKVKIICPIHGVFEQRIYHHRSGTGCPKCSADHSENFKSIVKTIQEFNKEANKIHSNKYDYKFVHYKNSQDKIKIICPEHGVFIQQMNAHLKGQGCSKCSHKHKYTTKEFIKKAKKIHGNKYDYKLVCYKNSDTKIKIICPEHDTFIQKANNHINGQGCPKCANNILYSKKEFIDKSNKMHDNKYDYSLVDYINNKTKIKIICPEHGVFIQKPYAHLQNRGCSVCNESKGEKATAKYLNDKNIQYIREYKFNDCKDKNLLPFDFYIPSSNILIEYDGEQHYKPIEHFGGIKAFNKLKYRDNIKTKYCENNNIKLIRIKYNQNVKDILLSEGV